MENPRKFETPNSKMKLLQMQMNQAQQRVCELEKNEEILSIKSRSRSPHLQKLIEKSNEQINKAKSIQISKNETIRELKFQDNTLESNHLDETLDTKTLHQSQSLLKKGNNSQDLTRNPYKIREDLSILNQSHSSDHNISNRVYEQLLNQIETLEKQNQLLQDSLKIETQKSNQLQNKQQAMIQKFRQFQAQISDTQQEWNEFRFFLNQNYLDILQQSKMKPILKIMGQFEGCQLSIHQMLVEYNYNQMDNIQFDFQNISKTSQSVEKILSEKNDIENRYFKEVMQNKKFETQIQCLLDELSKYKNISNENHMQTMTSNVSKTQMLEIHRIKKEIIENQNQIQILEAQKQLICDEKDQIKQDNTELKSKLNMVQNEFEKMQKIMQQQAKQQQQLEKQISERLEAQFSALVMEEQNKKIQSDYEVNQMKNSLQKIFQNTRHISSQFLDVLEKFNNTPIDQIYEASLMIQQESESKKNIILSLFNNIIQILSDHKINTTSNQTNDDLDQLIFQSLSQIDQYTQKKQQNDSIINQNKQYAKQLDEMREEVLNLNQQLKDSKTKLINYKTQLEELMMNKEQIDLLMMENKNSNELKSNKELIKNQNIQLQINDEQILQLNKKLKDASIYITQITEQNKKNISEYQIKLNQQDDILMELQKKLKMLSEKNIQLISKDENFEKQQRTDMNLIKQLQNNVENQENQLQIVKVELRNKEDEILLLKQNNLLMEQNIQKRECSQENEEISKIVLQLNQIKEENQNYLNIQSQYKDQVINLNKQNDQMKITIIQQLQSFEQLKEENEILKQQISKIDSQLDSARNEIQLVKTKENGLSTHIDHLNKIYQADQKIKKDLIQNIKNYEQDLTDNKQLNLLQKQHAEDQNIIQQLSQSNQELKFKIEDFQNQQIIDQKIQMDLQDQIQEFNQVFKKQAHNNSLIEIVSPIDNTLSLIEDLKNLKQRVITMASENENLIIMQNQNSESQEIEEKQFFQQYINDVNQFKKELQSNLIQLVQKLQIQINLTDSTCDSSISFEYIYALIKMISQALESQQYQLQNNTLQENINIQNQQTNQYDKSFNLLDYDKNIDDLLCSDEIFISQEKISNQNESTYQQQVHISKQSIIYDNFNNQQQSQIELIQMLLLQASTLEEMLSQNK